VSATELARDALFGNPPSPTIKPSREGVLAAFTTLDEALAYLVTAFIADQSVVLAELRDQLFADLAPANGALGIVYGDIPSRRGVYVKVGASNAGTWSATGLMGTGPAGTPATIAVGSVTSGTTASVTNSGTASAAILDFVLKTGPDGKSFYQIALDTGYVPAGTTETQFINTVAGQVAAAATAQAQASAVSAGQSAGSAGASAATAVDRAMQASSSLDAIVAALGGYPHGATLTAPFASRALMRTAAKDAGAALILTEGERLGVFIWNPGDMSAVVSADPQEGISVAPASDLTGASGAFMRADVKDELRAEWFGAVGDGVEQPDGTCLGTDNTTAIQSALNLMGYLNGPELVYGYGIFLIAGARTGPANAQISLPIFGDQSDQRVYRMRGAAPQSMTWATNRGTVLRSTLTASSDGQMFGAKHPGRGVEAEQHNHAVWAGVYVQDIAFRTAVGHPITHFDASYLPFYKFTNVRFDVPLLARPKADGTAEFINSEPMTATSYGLKGAKNDLPLRCLLDNVCFAGCNTGLKIGELSGGDNITFIANKRAIEVPNIRHGAKLGYVLLCNNQGGIFVTATEPAKMLIDYYDIEHNDATSMGSGPAWVTPLTDDIHDPDFMLNGSCNVHYHSNNFVTNLPFKINGESVESDSAVYLPNFRLKFVELSRNNEWPTPLFFPGFFLQDSAVHVVRRGVDTNDSRRVAWHALATKQLNTGNGLLGGYVFLNESIADGTEKRMAGVVSEMNGAGSGSLLFYTTNGNQFTPKWGINPAGDLRALTPGAKLLGVAANTPLGGILVLSSQSSITYTYDHPYNSAPRVHVTPGVLPADAICRVQSYTDRFVVEIKKTDDTLYAVSGSLHYSTMGNPD
jgi:hypothetical protein